MNIPFVKDCITNKLVRHPHIGTEEMCTDIFTKFNAPKKAKNIWVRVHNDVKI